MKDGIFKITPFGHSYARATEVMSTQSETDFKWSVKLLGDFWFSVGIASQLKREENRIFDYDHDAILYYTNRDSPIISIGSNTIHSNLRTQEIGDIIRLRFQPQRKKLVIDLVRELVFNSLIGYLDRSEIV